MKKIITSIIATFTVVVMTPLVAFAHVVVTPSQANVGQRVLFAVSVPNERESAVSSVKLTLPKGLADVQPNVMAGWTIATDKSGDDVTAITWTGAIPSGQRADLLFKAQVPAKAGDLDWNANQTYADGTVVSWDQKPSASEGDNDSATSGPYSVTKVVDDLNEKSAMKPMNNAGVTTLALALGIIATVFSAFSLLRRRR